MSPEIFDAIAKNLGVPQRVFAGASGDSISSALIEHDQRRIDKLRTFLEANVLQPMIRKHLEKEFPEMFWEPIFLLSPRGRMMVRRKEPIKINWDRGA